MIAVSQLTVPEVEPASAERAERLKQAIKSAGTARLVSEKSGVPLGTLNAYLAGREMKFSNVTALAQATGVRLEWLATGAGPMHSSESGIFETGTEMAGEDMRLLPPDTVLIARFDARASAGTGTQLDDSVMLEKVPFPAAFLPDKLRRKPEHLALIECTGDSMEPTLHDGDELLVDLSITTLRAGGIYILRSAGALLTKRVSLRLDGTALIMSDNPRYPTETVRRGDPTDIDVVGEVIWRGGSLRA
jgi:phage repressor protein C with HTH and peptisase S24 domain